MKSKFYIAIPLCVFILLAIVLFLGIGKNPQHLESARIGQPMPAFELPILSAEQNNSQSITAQQLIANQNQPWLLNVWASWCPQCYAEHGFISAIANTGTRVVGLNYKDTQDNAHKFLNEMGNPYELSLFDSAGDLGFDLGVYGAPETFLLDAQGQILIRHAGVLDRKIWQEKFAQFFTQPIFKPDSAKE